MGVPPTHRELEDLRHEPRLQAADPCRPPGLGEVYTWKTGGQQVSPVQRGQAEDVRVDPKVGETLRKDTSRRLPQLAQAGDTVASPGKAQLKAPDARKGTERYQRCPWPGEGAKRVPVGHGDGHTRTSQGCKETACNSMEYIIDGLRVRC